jgi:hypothetical protein
VSGLSMEQKVFTKEEMPVKNEHIPKQQEIKKWSHLTGIDVPDINSDIGIMIGNKSCMSFSVQKDTLLPESRNAYVSIVCDLFLSLTRTGMIAMAHDISPAPSMI